MVPGRFILEIPKFCSFYRVVYIQWILYMFSIHFVHTGLLHFESQAMRYFFDFYTLPHFNNLLYFDLSIKFWNDFIIHSTEEGPHMWPKRLPYFLRFLYLPLITIFNVKMKSLPLCQNNKMNKNSLNQIFIIVPRKIEHLKIWKVIDLVRRFLIKPSQNL